MVKTIPKSVKYFLRYMHTNTNGIFILLNMKNTKILKVQFVLLELNNRFESTLYMMHDKIFALAALLLNRCGI